MCKYKKEKEKIQEDGIRKKHAHKWKKNALKHVAEKK